jgi:DNA-binding winged helix-turn-helix (wHTH) protein
MKFGPFTLDERARQLLGGSGAIHLSPKAFDLLLLLARDHPAAVSKERIHQQLWPDTFVSETNLAVLVAEIRGALGEDARRPRYIRTINRFGYAFSGSLAATGAAPLAPGFPSCSLAWSTGLSRLGVGEHVIGRDAAADVCIPAVGISRRHALIVVTDETVTLRDLSSKNGTFVNDRRVIEPVVLRDGAEIRLGPVRARFQRLSRDLSTQTVEAPPAN